MAPMRNWLAFTSPPIEMLFPNPSVYLDADHVEIHRLAASPPVVKLEDFLGGQRTLSLGSNLPVYDSMEYSSSFMPSTALPLSSGDLEDSSSATGNNYLCLSHLHQQPAADSTPIKTKTTTMRTPAVSCQRTSIYRGVTR
ncbi:hypothetical protein KSP39_PZI023844 [Platanthera zijinensis]|uniref:Uncharacterized protein n=1 Tax=Platanthera zijinensis TaxID=2320716 RepID=A0AAP0ATE5_9ASPA